VGGCPSLGDPAGGDPVDRELPRLTARLVAEHIGDTAEVGAGIDEEGRQHRLVDQQMRQLRDYARAVHDAEQHLADWPGNVTPAA
jgi:hypothetical protein